MSNEQRILPEEILNIMLKNDLGWTTGALTSAYASNLHGKTCVCGLGAKYYQLHGGDMSRVSNGGFVELEKIYGEDYVRGYWHGFDGAMSMLQRKRTPLIDEECWDHVDKHFTQGYKDGVNAAVLIRNHNIVGGL